MVVWKKAPLKEKIFGIVTLYQVTPPSLVRSTYELPIAQPLDVSIMDKLRMTGEETTGPGEGVTVVGGIGVSVGGGIGVNVGEGIEASHAKVDITCAKTTDSAASS